MYTNTQHREYMKSLAGAVVAFFLLPFASLAEESANPDILLIMPDQMRGDCLSTLGHPAVRTPEMDQLAGQGVLFRRAYTTVASCIPARYAFSRGSIPRPAASWGLRQSRLRHRRCRSCWREPATPPCWSAGTCTRLLQAGTVATRTGSWDPPTCGDDDYDSFFVRPHPNTGGIRALSESWGSPTTIGRQRRGRWRTSCTPPNGLSRSRAKR